MIKTFISCKIIVYILHKHMDAVDSTDFFSIFASHLVNIAIIAKGRVGLENDPGPSATSYVSVF